VKDLAPAAIGEAEELATILSAARDLDPAVHTTRKGTKRLRSYLRLAKQSIGTKVYRSENAALRDAARLIAPARDALVLVETAREMNASRSVITTLEHRHAREMTHLESGVRAEAIRRLESVASRWKGIEWLGPEAASVRAGLARTYRRGLADYAAVQAKPNASGFHTWRRRVKYVRYQLKALGLPRAVTRTWLTLGDDLGGEHDHTVLIGVCRTYGDDDGFRSLAKRAKARRKALRATALETGDRLLVLEPNAFVASVASAAGLEES
jgi:hypothetical protein